MLCAPTGNRTGAWLRIVTAMEGSSPGSAAGRSDTVNRRQLLALAGSFGVAVAVGACSTNRGLEVVPVPNSSVNPPPGTPPAAASTALVTSAPATPVPAATPAVMLCRSAWQAQPALPGGRPHNITRMTLHHTAAVLGDNRNAPARLRQHQQFHQNDRGWIDIAYHVGVDRNGNIYELRDTGLAGDTATDYDPAGHFLVLCEGDFDQETVSEAQLNSAALAFAWATQHFKIGSDTLGGHSDYAFTACPGANLAEHLTSGDLQRRIDERLAAGPVDLQKVCGPEAAATVAAIEAGL